MDTILVAVDLRHGTEPLMKETCKYAKALNAGVVLVDVEPLLPGAEGTGAEEVTRDMESGYSEEIQTVHDLGLDLTAKGIDNRVLIIEGSAADQLVKEAEREAASLIIIGSLPHGAIVEVLTHGIREQLAKRVRCPILLVPME